MSSHWRAYSVPDYLKLLQWYKLQEISQYTCQTSTRETVAKQISQISPPHIPNEQCQLGNTTQEG